MKAIGYCKTSTGDIRLEDIDIPCPNATGHDLLVEVKAVSVNPVDTKVRKISPADQSIKVLGWDAVGVVKAVGENVTLFSPGDRVWYAGALNRQGSNAEFQLVDESIVGRCPNTLSFAEAAALPLTGITAWELLFERLEVQRGKSDATILVIGASGGVGSMLIQLAKQLTSLNMIATASRKESIDWLRGLGVEHIIDHHQPMPPQLAQLGFNSVDYIVSLNATQQHFPAIAEMIKPQGKVALIDDPEQLDIRLLKRKSASLHWEYMFTKAIYATPDILSQHHILNEMAALVESGQIRTTMTTHIGPINALNLMRAHREIEQGAVIGKLVLEGFH